MNNININLNWLNFIGKIKMICRLFYNAVLTISRKNHNVCFIYDTTGLLKINFGLNNKRELLHSSAVFLSQKLEKSNADSKSNQKVLKVWQNITVKEVCKALNVDLATMSALLPGYNLKPNDKIESPELLKKGLSKIGWKLIISKKTNESNEKKKVKETIQQPPSKEENLVKRPPVVTVMGHVDHGKTTLLDSLRNTFVVAQEFGGITQHIGAFTVEIKPGELITFIDTPGHAAFAAMRSRGAQVTDLVVLVIAADDGVMAQTIESINLIKKAEVRLIIAVNKIDKPNAMKIDEIKNKLLEEGIQVEDRGGSVQLVPISALKKINLDLLTEVILLEADLMNLKGDPTGLVEAVVIESNLDSKIGVVATVIIKRGTLKKGKILLAGKTFAKVRRMLDENAKEYEKALPSTPVQILGWKSLPEAGEKVFEVLSEKEAKKIIKERVNEELSLKREKELPIIEEKAKLEKEKHEELSRTLKSAENRAEKRKLYFTLVKTKKEEVSDNPRLDIIVKADVFGTLEVLLQVLSTYNEHNECELHIVSSSVGHVTESDLESAEFFNAKIFAFNVKLCDNLESIKDSKNVDIHYHNVLYKLIDDLKSELNSRILPKKEEKVLGEAEVLMHFDINEKNKKIPVAGCKCTKGELFKKALFKVVRDEQVIFRGNMSKMKHHKNEVNSIVKGKECGLMLENFEGKFETGDTIVCYEIIDVPQTTTWDPGF